MARSPLRALALVASLVSLLGVPLLARAQLAQDAPSPARGHAQVVAQGVAAMPADRVAWRVVEDTAELPADAPVQARALGFALADAGAVAIDDLSSGVQHRLAPGEAAFVPNGVQQRRASLGDAPVPYYRLALVPEADAGDAGGDTLLFAGEGFAAPVSRTGGGFDLDLVRDVLVRTEEAELAGTGAPTLVLATAGAIEVAFAQDQRPMTLAAGEAAAFAGDLIVAAGDPRAENAFVAAVLGPEVPPSAPPPPAPETGAATLTVLLWECPAGYAGDDLAADCSTPIAGVAFSLRPEESDERDFVTTDPNGVAVFELGPEELPGTFQLIEELPPAELPDTSVEVVCSRNGTEAVDFERTDVERNAPRGGLLAVEPGDAVFCAWYNVPAAPPADASLVIQGWVCPAGYAGAAYYDDCRGTPLAGARFTVARVGSDQRIAGTTDAGGGVVLAVPAAELPNTISVVTGLEGFAGYEVNCSRGGERVAVDYPPGAAAAEALLAAAPGDEIRCDWFLIPPGSAGVERTLTVGKVVCPPELAAVAAPSREDLAVCTVPAQFVGFRVTGDGYDQTVETDNEGRAVFTGLPAGAVTVTELGAEQFPAIFAGCGGVLPVAGASAAVEFTEGFTDAVCGFWNVVPA